MTKAYRSQRDSVKAVISTIVNDRERMVDERREGEYKVIVCYLLVSHFVVVIKFWIAYLAKHFAKDLTTIFIYKLDIVLPT